MAGDVIWCETVGAASSWIDDDSFQAIRTAGDAIPSLFLKVAVIGVVGSDCDARMSRGDERGDDSGGKAEDGRAVGRDLSGSLFARMRGGIELPLTIFSPALNDAG